MEEQPSDKSKSSNHIKIILIGSLEAGKTNLIGHYLSKCGSSFVQIKKVIKGKNYILDLWDTAAKMQI